MTVACLFVVCLWFRFVSYFLRRRGSQSSVRAVCRARARARAASLTHVGFLLVCTLDVQNIWRSSWTKEPLSCCSEQRGQDGSRRGGGGVLLPVSML